MLPELYGRGLEGQAWQGTGRRSTVEKHIAASRAHLPGFFMSPYRLISTQAKRKNWMRVSVLIGAK